MSNPVVLWDMDGTLIDSEPLHKRALEASIEAYDIVLPDDFDEQSIGMTVDMVYLWLQEHFDFPAPFDTWIVEKYAFYMSHLSSLKAFPGALELWHALGEHGIRQAVVSNSDRMIVNANLTALGLMTSKLVSVSRNDIRHGKPDPEPYLRALYLLDAEPSNAVVLEDSVPGAKAGLAAGAKTFFVPPSEFTPPEGAQKLSSYEAVLDLLKLR